MSNQYRLLVFGLPAGTNSESFAEIAGPAVPGHTSLIELPGESHQTMAVMPFGSDSHAARRMAQRLERRAGRPGRLQAWLCVMPWA